MEKPMILSCPFGAKLEIGKLPDGSGIAKCANLQRPYVECKDGPRSLYYSLMQGADRWFRVDQEDTCGVRVGNEMLFSELEFRQETLELQKKLNANAKKAIVQESGVLDGATCRALKNDSQLAKYWPNTCEKLAIVGPNPLGTKPGSLNMAFMLGIAAFSVVLLVATVQGVRSASGRQYGRL
jgi:hypothetical protein